MTKWKLVRNSLLSPWTARLLTCQMGFLKASAGDSVGSAGTQLMIEPRQTFASVCQSFQLCSYLNSLRSWENTHSRRGNMRHCQLFGFLKFARPGPNLWLRLVKLLRIISSQLPPSIYLHVPCSESNQLLHRLWCATLRIKIIFFICILGNFTLYLLRREKYRTQELGSEIELHIVYNPKRLFSMYAFHTTLSRKGSFAREKSISKGSKFRTISFIVLRWPGLCLFK